MLPGDIALYRPHGFVGRVICYVTRSRYCHVRLIVDADGTTVEANPPGAFRGKVQEGDVVVSVPLTDEQRAKVPALAEALVDTPYGFLDVLVLGLAQFGLRLPFLRKRLGRTDRLFCSQLVDLVWGEVDFEAFDDKRLPQNVSPGDLADLAFASGWAATTIEEGIKQ
jgi:hypothetical protein